MQIKIPHIVTRSWNAFCKWGDVPLWTYGHRTFRRLDAVLVIGFIVCVGRYYLSGGWLGALQGAAFYILAAMIGMWML
jgi:hypothetical protein